MQAKKIILNGGIILLICLACILPAVAIELNPLSYIIKKPVQVQAVNKSLAPALTHVPVERMTALPRITSAASSLEVTPGSQVASTTASCTQDTPGTVLEGTISELVYSQTYSLTLTIMKLPGGAEIMLHPVQSGDRDRMYQFFETAWGKGNRIKVYTTSGCSITDYYGYDGTARQYPTYSVMQIHLGPVHP